MVCKSDKARPPVPMSNYIWDSFCLYLNRDETLKNSQRGKKSKRKKMNVKFFQYNTDKTIA